MRYLLLFGVISVFALSSRSQTVADFSANPVCQGDTLYLVDLSTSTGNITNYYWDLDNDGFFTDDSAQNLALPNLPGGTYQIGLRVISDLPDTAEVYYTADVYPLPVTSFSLDNSVYCLGDSVKVSYDNSPNTGLNVTHYWEDNIGNSFIHDRDTVLFYNQIGIFTLKLSAKNTGSAINCWDSSRQSFRVIGSNASFATSAPATCINETIRLSNTSSICGSVVDLSWDYNGDGVYSEANGDSVYFSSAVAGTFTVRMRMITDRDTTYASRIIIVDPKPIASFTVDRARQVEPGNVFTFTNNSTISTGGLLHLWKMGDAVSLTDENPVHSYGSSGTFTVTLVSTSSLPAHCSDTFSLNVEVYPTEPSMKADTVCFGNSTSLRNTSISSETITNVVWDLDGDGQFDDGNGQNISYIFPRFGSIPVRMQMTTPANVYVVSAIVDVLPKAFGDFLVDEVCAGSASNFRPVLNILPGTGNVDMQWDFDQDGTVDLSSSASLQTVSFTYPASGNYQPVLYLLTAGGCIDTVRGNASVISAPVPSFTSGNACIGQSIRFTNTTLAGNDPISLYLWTMGDGNSRTDTGSFNYTYARSGTFEVNLYVQSTKGCNANFKQSVQIFDLPQINISVTDINGIPSDPELIPGDSLELSISGSFASVNWAGVAGNTNSVRVGNGGTYGVFATSSDGCVGYDEMTITELPRPELIIRNVITPNGDGMNDRLQADNVKFYAPLKITVYHNSGAQVFSSDNYQNDWEPEYNAKSLSEGLYFYYAEDKNGKTYQGTISIVK